MRIFNFITLICAYKICAMSLLGPVQDTLCNDYKTHKLQITIR